MHSYINELGALTRSAAESFGKQRRVAAIFVAFAAVVVFTISTGALTVNAVDDVIATITVPESVSITAGSDARDKWDAAIEVAGGVIAIGSPGDSIAVPVAVPVDWRLESLTDPTTGITIVRNENGAVLRIPIRDADGNDTIRVLVNTTEFIGDGWHAYATINSMSIDLPTRSRDFSEVDSEVGVASVKILGEITGFPGSSVMNMSIAKSADDEVARTVELLAADQELEVADVAYVVGLDKTNLDQVLGEMTLRLTVGKRWADKYGLENVRVVRIADDGSTQIFEWVAVDANADPVQFNLVSPNGLSKFVIEALRKTQATPTPTPTATPTLTPTPTVTPSPTLVPTAVPTATEVPTSTPTATVTSVSPTTTAATTSPTVAPSPTRVPDPTATSISPTVEPTSVPTATSAPPTNTIEAAVVDASADPEEVASGSSCNAAIPSGSVGIGQLAFLLFPLGLLVYKKRVRD